MIEGLPDMLEGVHVRQSAASTASMSNGCASCDQRP
jgi:hypothetical protein